MKKIVKLTEADLYRIVKRVINEQSKPKLKIGDTVEVKNGQGLMYIGDICKVDPEGYIKLKNRDNICLEVPYSIFDTNYYTTGAIAGIGIKMVSLDKSLIKACHQWSCD